MRVVQLERRIATLEESLTYSQVTNERLRVENLEWKRKFFESESRAEHAETRLMALEAQILSNSSNSSLPPSTDKFKHMRAGVTPRVKTGLKRGGQPGHPGSTLDRLEPDEIIDVSPALCVNGHDISSVPVEGFTRRQVQDIITFLQTVDYEGGRRRCPTCQAVTEAVFPLDARGPVNHGSGLKTIALGLASFGLLPSRVVSSILEGFLGVKVSSSSVKRWMRTLGESLDDWDKEMRDQVRHVPLVHADETPIRVDGMRNAQLHVVCGPLFTLYHIAPRSKAGIASGGVIENHPGTLVTDGLVTYWGMGVAAHQACLAHLIRDVQKLVDIFQPNDETIQHPYPQLGELQTLLRASVHDPSQPAGVTEAETRRILDQLDAVFKGRKDYGAGKTLALSRRMRKLLGEGELYRFMTVEGVPPTNNLAEQAIRFAKIQQRRSMTHRSLPHARASMRVASYLDTARKNGVDPTEAVKQAFKGTPYLPILNPS
jgi:transposase